MKKILKKLIIYVDPACKDEFQQKYMKENLNNIIGFGMMFGLMELIFFFLYRNQYDRITLSIILSVTAYFTIVVPLAVLLKHKNEKGSRHANKLITVLFYVTVFFTFSWSVVITLYLQTVTTIVFPYIMIMLFGAIAFINHPSKSIVFYLFAYISLFVLLPLFQADSEIVAVHRTNTFYTMIASWVFSYTYFKLRARIFSDSKIIEHQYKELQKLVNRDAMTLLYNHSYSYELLGKEISRTKRSGSPLSVILVDIDNFKKVNDEYGHTFGDKVIVSIAAIFKKCVRENDITGRYGGEEFVIIMPDTTLDCAVSIANRVKDAISREPIENTVTITASMGVAQYKDESPVEIITKVDDMLYKAKMGGRNRVEC